LTVPPETPPSSVSGWRLPSSRLSLPEVHGSIAVPEGAGFWRKMFAFAGPGYLVAVGYMDPGNWATDLAGGARFGYTLLSVIMLFLQHRGFRYVEALVVALIVLIAGSFAVEIWLSRPDLTAVATGFIPRAQILRDGEMLYIAIGILGATVMPHNLYLHSSIVQTRDFGASTRDRREAVRYAVFDSTLALGFALFINAAILVLGAAAFHTRGLNNVAEIADPHK